MPESESVGMGEGFECLYILSCRPDPASGLEREMLLEEGGKGRAEGKRRRQRRYLPSAAAPGLALAWLVPGCVSSFVGVGRQVVRATVSSSLGHSGRQSLMLTYDGR